ncbi:MAG: hypothetical protein A3G20_08785 [Acidobacteria bacterium RIFCSPLOWO2_12_FULL_59_11]|nr:MAG: hypothetical protein A3G20_08785 [Acidobacteria bacterium RIFCSPLOWO2_12_FULL_59_11]
MRLQKGIAFLVLAFLWISGAVATTFLPMNLDDLTAESPAIAYGKIVASRTEWNSTHTLIYTVYTVQAMEYLHGDLGPSFELQEPGGELDGFGLLVPGVPRFTVGQEAILFVWTDPQEQHQVTGDEQGSLTVQRDPATGLKMVNRVVRLGSAKSAGSVGPTTSRFLPQLFHQIRSSAAKARKPAANQ